MGLDTLVKVFTPGAHICAERRLEGKKDYWLAFEWDAMKTVIYFTAGAIGYSRWEQISGFLQQL